MGPPAPRRRWVPKPIDEVAAPIRPSPLPLVGARRPPTKLPALNEKLPDLKPVFGLRRPEEVNDFEEPADLGLGRWLEGGKASALRLHSGLRVLDDLKGSDALKKPKIAFNLLTFLASELLDAGRSRERPRTLLLKRLVLLLETSIFPSKELQRKVMQEASHSVALAEDNIHTQRDTSQVLEDVVKVNQWQLEETIRPRLSPQEMWTRRSGMSSSQGPVIRWTGAEDADLLSLVAASNIQRWHCTQLIEQARWVNEIDSSREAQISAAYNMLGLVQELTGGFAVGNASRTFALPFALVLLVRPSWDAFLTSAAEVPDTSRRHAVGLATLVALRTEPAKAAGAATQILASKDALDKLRADECWTRVDCNGDDIRRVAGTVGTVSPLFKIKDALMEVYMEEPSGVPELEDVLQHLSQLDYQAYCTIFAINGGPESFRKFMAQASAALDVCVKDFTALAKVVSA